MDGFKCNLLYKLTICSPLTPASPAATMSTLRFPMANDCTTVTSVLRTVRQFRFDGFSLLTETMCDGEFIRSRWDIDGCEWEIQCYPAWLESGYRYVAFKLMLLTEAGTCSVKARLGCYLVLPPFQIN